MKLSYSESINTGVAFSYIIGLQLAANVRSEQNTVSPSFIPNSLIAKCIAEVPDTNAAASFIPTYSATSFSKLFTLGPSGAIQFVSNASFIKLSSSPPICGEAKYILLFSFCFVTSIRSASFFCKLSLSFNTSIILFPPMLWLQPLLLTFSYYKNLVNNMLVLFLLAYQSTYFYFLILLQILNHLFVFLI